MNTPPDTNPPTDLNDQVDALQRQIFALLLALIVVSGTLTVYLYRQASMTGKDITALHQQADGIIRGFQQNQTGMISFVNQLVIYSETHPDFRPVLMKFGVNPPAAAPAAPKK